MVFGENERGEIELSIETLYKNQWLSLKVIREPEAGVNGYVFSHESRCQGKIVAVLPFRTTHGRREYLVKSEVTPCWSMKPVVSALTGGYEGGDIADDAVRELYEEAGYAVDVSELIPLGESYASKSADTVYSLFAVDVTDKKPVEPPGDGSRLESEAKTFWYSESELALVWDPQVSTMLVRLRQKLAREDARDFSPPDLLSITQALALCRSMILGGEAMSDPAAAAIDKGLREAEKAKAHFGS